MNPSRRTFLKNAAVVGMGFTALRNLTGCEQPISQLPPTKPLTPENLFRLPRGFECQIISQAGKKMSDGFNTPGAHDGMAAFEGENGKIILVCNHELEAGSRDSGPFGKNNELFDKIDQSRLYDAGSGKAPCLGGTTTLIYDPASGKVEREFLSLAGTARNCAGGPTPWGSWITCEETTQLAEGNYEQDHGYNFEVPASRMELTKARAIRGMGRFNHEAVAVSDRMIVYQTEDRPDGLIYRYIPNQRDRDRANLLAGGRLQALKLRDYRTFDTRNWRVRKMSPYQQWDVEWVDLEDIESVDDELRLQGYFQHGCARFARGEGMWYGQVGDGNAPAIYFACTNGGKKKNGQVFRYIPSPREGEHDESDHPGKLELYVEMDDGNICSMCDNLTLSDRGEVYLCEDNSRANKRIIRVTPERKIYEFAECIWNSSELAGVTFSPDYQTLFVNVQFPGITVAIRGPWETLKF